MIFGGGIGGSEYRIGGLKTLYIQNRKPQDSELLKACTIAMRLYLKNKRRYPGSLELLRLLFELNEDLRQCKKSRRLRFTKVNCGGVFVRCGSRLLWARQFVQARNPENIKAATSLIDKKLDRKKSNCNAFGETRSAASAREPKKGVLAAMLRLLIKEEIWRVQTK